MDKNSIDKYDLWNEKKKNIEKDDKYKNIYFNEGDIWWCSLGLNIGSESYGKGNSFRRPILVIKKLSSDLCITASLTTKRKIGTWFTDIVINNNQRCVMIYQIRTLHKKRFQHKIGKLNDKDFINVKEKLDSLLELSLNHHPIYMEIEGNIPKVESLYAYEEFKSISSF